jgi:Castor and Pollux protein voltage-gated ion channel component
MTGSNPGTFGGAKHRRFRRARASGGSGPAKQGQEAAPTGDRRPGVGPRLRYRFDTQLSRGPIAVITWLAVVTLVIVLVAAAVLTIFKISGVGGENHNDLAQSFWQSLLRVLDTGTIANDTAWPARLVGLIVTLAGIIIAGSLIGLIANGVDLRIEELRKGRSLVVETDHTLILGWSARVPAIVRELVIANESESHAAVVVLAERDKNEMEAALHDFIGDPRSTRIVCRSGEPWLPANLELANFAHAKSVVVMGAGSDAATVKALLAVRAVSRPAGGAPKGSFHIVAEVEDPDTATSLLSLFSDQLVVVNSDSIVAELTAQACRKQGFSYVFRELLQFEGDELYIAPFPQLDGRSYADCQLAFEKCSVIGYLDATGTVRLNPPPQTPISAQDELIAIAEDDSAYVISAVPASGSLLPADSTPRAPAERRIVICGWSELGPRVVEELDEFFGAETTIVLLLDSERVDVAGVSAQVVARNVNVEVNVLVGGPEAIAAHAAQRAFHEVIVLGYRDNVSTDDADARTLLTLLAFRQVDQANVTSPPVRIVAELLDQRNSPLANAIGADDFIVSDELTSLMIAQLSERRELDAVFKDLFDREGASVELFDGARYGATHAGTFADIVMTASAQGHSAIGYRVARTNTVVINPAKSAPVQLAERDEILVISDEGHPGERGEAPARSAVPAT